MNVLIWHVHGSWTTAFVQGPHTYLVPVVPGRGADGRGRAATWDWPANAIELTPEQLRNEPIDLVVVQEPRHEQLLYQWTGRRLRRDVPAIWLEHNAPEGSINGMRHPAADRDDITIAHVTQTNRLFWDCGSTRTTVIEHGVIDPGHLYTGELPRAGVVVNEPVRRARVTGTDLLASLAETVPLDVFGMAVGELRGPRVSAFEDLTTQAQMHRQLARRRVYLHPVRWTSLGLSLVEAMHLGMPVVALATTEVPEAVPPGAGTVSNNVDVLKAALRRYANEPEEAAACGRVARAAALARFGLDRFLFDWDQLIKEGCA
jgi:glycosyltransferase involved in cell wall biosynthesis